MSGFLDFARGLFDSRGWGAIIPPVLSSLLTPKPKNQVDLGSLIPYYEDIARQARAANEFANQQAEVYRTQYLPRAINMARRAESVGTPQDQMQRAGETAANYSQAMKMQEGAIARKFGGDPRRGGYGAAIAQLKANYVPGMLTAMNTTMRGREEYGDRLRQTALTNLAVNPNFNVGTGIMGNAANSIAGLSQAQDANYRQRLADTTKAVKLPWDIHDEQRRREEDRADLDRIIGVLERGYRPS